MRLINPSDRARRRTAVAGVAFVLGWLSSLGANSSEALSAQSPARPARVPAPRARAAAPHTTPAPTGSRAAPRPTAASGAPGPGAPSVAAVTPPATPPVDCHRVKCVALTFDDGPGPYTAKLLDMLDARHVRVTFFLVGSNIKGREALVRREIADGDAIGDHTWSHPDLTGLSEHPIRSQLRRTLAAIQGATGGTTRLMRPPYGATDHRVAATARQMGMAQILWSVDTNDWRDRNSRIVAHRAISWAHRGDIILMHDIHPTTVDAVPKILRGLARRGFTFVTVPELLGDSLEPGKVFFDGPRHPAKDAPAGDAEGDAAGTAPASPSAAPAASPATAAGARPGTPGGTAGPRPGGITVPVQAPALMPPVSADGAPSSGSVPPAEPSGPSAPAPSAAPSG